MHHHINLALPLPGRSAALIVKMSTLCYEITVAETIPCTCIHVNRLKRPLVCWPEKLISDHSQEIHVKYPPPVQGLNLAHSSTSNTVDY